MRSTLWWLLGLACLAACGDDDGGGYHGTGSADHTGASCAVADECYPEVDHGDLAGEVRCDTSVEGGYCTHSCLTHADCCATPGECESDFPQVCAQFEDNLGQMFCFLACSGEYLNGQDPTEFCVENASPRFVCRSTGGGPLQRLACLPPG
jgi:hypothetical protein